MYYKTISKKNSQFQVFQSYRLNRNKRSRDEKIFIEGVVPINCAVDCGLDIDAALIPEGKHLSDWAYSVIQTVQPNNVYKVSAPLLSEISGKENASELILIANRPKWQLTDAELKTFQRVLILDRPSSPGNLGTILRSCDAFEVDCVLIIGHAVDQFDPRTITASRGVVFKVPILTGLTNAELTELGERMKRDYQFRFYGTSAKGDSRLEALEFSKRSCFIIGNEARGMSQHCRELADETVVIPIFGYATSLNIACATSIILYQLSINQPKQDPAQLPKIS